MTFKVTEPPSNRKVLLNLKHLKNQSVRGIRQGFYIVGKMAITEINRAVLEKPRSGQVYRYKGRKHVASRAGESFANRSGAARRTRGFDVKGADQVEFGFRENGETIYTDYLENPKNKATARPTVGNASKKVQGRVQNIMEKEIEKAHKQGYR